MIVSCPVCSSQYRITISHANPSSLRLRCGRCQTRFVAIDSVRTSNPLQVLVAHSDTNLCQAVGEVLSSAAISYAVCHDGPSALSSMELNPPDVLLVDVALPGLYVFEVVETLRLNSKLQNVRTILLSSVYNRTAYKRRPTSLYGADDYIEKHHIPTDLVAKISQLTGKKPPQNPTNIEIGKSFAEVSSKEPAPDFVDRVNDRLLQAELLEIDGRSAFTSASRAERLARIIVGDISLYSQEMLDKAILEGNFDQVMQREKEEARRIFDKCAPPGFAGRHDFLDIAFSDLVEHRRVELDNSGE